MEQVDQGTAPDVLASAPDDRRLDEMSDPEHADRRHGTPIGGKTERASQPGGHDEQEATPADSGSDKRRLRWGQGLGLGAADSRVRVVLHGGFTFRPLRHIP